jgi:fluoride ion exporter CrcB/FEX
MHKELLWIALGGAIAFVLRSTIGGILNPILTSLKLGVY